MDGRRISGSGLAAVDAAGDVISDSEVEDVARASSVEDPVPLGAAVEAVDEARAPRLPHNPGRPTKREIAEHCVSHWPFRSWCRHCVCGRAAGSPHKVRSDADREFGRARIPTISMDHCFLGSAEDDGKALGSPFLILVDSETEAIYAIAVSDKAAKPWVVEYVFSILVELGYAGVKVAIKHDAAPELRELRRQISIRRSAPTVPIDVPVRESKANGAVEKAVRTWQGQFRTLKSHLEAGIGMTLARDHPILQWCAWWSASLLNRVAIKSHGRTVFEYATGHKMKTPLAMFGEAILWRAKRHVGALNKYDSEWADGVFLGVSGMGTSILVGTKNGIVRTNDFRMAPEGR